MDIHVPQFRSRQGRIDHSTRIDRYWKNKETGVRVEVKRFYRVVDEGRYQVIFFEPEVNHELSLPLGDMMKRYDPDGNVPRTSNRNVSYRKRFKLK